MIFWLVFGGLWVLVAIAICIAGHQDTKRRQQVAYLQAQTERWINERMST